jgi:hypothetical protein
MVNFVPVLYPNFCQQYQSGLEEFLLKFMLNSRIFIKPYFSLRKVKMRIRNAGKFADFERLLHPKLIQKGPNLI